jgi:hypothetical protein
LGTKRLDKLGYAQHCWGLNEDPGCNSVKLNLVKVQNNRIIETCVCLSKLGPIQWFQLQNYKLINRKIVFKEFFVHPRNSLKEVVDTIF